LSNLLRPSLIQANLWRRRHAHYIAVIERALLLLREVAALPVDEPHLVRELRFKTITARRQLDPKGQFGSPCFESQNLPDPDHERAQAFEYKRPDIQWRHDDESAPDDRHREKSFVIECKRLGNTTAARWNLNQQYVIGGVMRFYSPDWRYGLHMADGMMVAFVQSMDLAEIQNIVNIQLAQNELPLLDLKGTFLDAEISRLDHEFERRFPISPFRLSHLWLDIRDVPVHATLPA
jgi:hypothetical protein